MFVCSDIHLEYRSGYSLPLTGELCILAGDILDPRETRKSQQFLEDTRRKFNQVVWVPGNHEYFGQTLDAAELQMIELAENTDVELLIRSSTEYRGIPIWGAPLWTPWPTTENSQLGVPADSERIMNFSGKDRNWQHQQDLWFLTGAPSRGIIVSHHPPFRDSVAPWHRGSARTPEYVNALEWFLKDWEGIWVFGHTHYPCYRQIGKTLCWSNPIGYPNEYLRPDFRLRNFNTDI